MIEYGNVQLPLLGGYDLKKSSQTVSFSNLTCDFTNHTSEDLPQRYEECRIYIKGDLKFVGYINGYSFKEMRETDDFLEISIELLSPMAMATLRTQTATGNYRLKNLINFVFEPLIDDGFTIEENNVVDRNISVNYVCETIEYIMSDLSANYNIWWFIDENKRIYIRDIKTMMMQDAKHIYDDTHKISGLEYLKPVIASQNYANVINFKNVRIYEYSRQNFDMDVHNPLINTQITYIGNGKELDFEYPIDFKEDNILKSADSLALVDRYVYGLYISGTYTDNTTFELYKTYDTLNGTWETTQNIGFDGNSESEEEFLLKRDPFFSNLIVGFKYNGSKTLKSITNIKSDSILIWNVNKFYNDSAIEKNKGIISPSGIVELTVDMNDKWMTMPSLMDIGSSYADKSSLSLDGTIEMGIDKDTFKVGDIIEINKMLFNGKYIFTSAKESVKNNHAKYIATCKNTNVESNYIDLFRDKTKQENSERTYQTFITHYTQEGIKESHEVVK